MRIQLFAIAALLSVSTASAETSPPAPSTETPAPSINAPVNSPMVRNIGIAEQGDAIIVRRRKAAPAPATKPDQK